MRFVGSFLPLLILAFFTMQCSDPNARNWDAQGYNANSKWQKRSAQEMIDLLDWQGNEQVLDVGSGDGKTSAFIAKKVPDGEVVAIDVSLQMVDFSRKNYLLPNLSFQKINIERINYHDEFDVISSFTTLHLVENQASVVKNMAKALKPGGNLLLQFPIEHGFGLALDRTMRMGQWHPFFGNFRTGWHFHGLNDWKRYLRDAGLTPTRIEMTTLDEVYASPEEFGKSISFWLPHLEVLPSGLREVFVEDLVRFYLKENPLDRYGRLHYPINRLEIEAYLPK